jgi:hypothetical protein
MGGKGDQVVRAMKFDRPDGVQNVESGAIPGIQGFYFFEYYYDDVTGEFVELRAFAQRGIGSGKVFNRAEVFEMLDYIGLDEEMQATLHQYVEPSEIGGGVLKGDAHRGEAEQARIDKRVSKQEKKKRALREQEILRGDAMRESGMFFCGESDCERPFFSEFWRDRHQEVCSERRAAQRAKTSTLRPAEELLACAILSSGRVGGGGCAGVPTCYFPTCYFCFKRK